LTTAAAAVCSGHVTVSERRFDASVNPAAS
jgi:hypothetical protein